jgi:hypothetical protein
MTEAAGVAFRRFVLIQTCRNLPGDINLASSVLGSIKKSLAQQVHAATSTRDCCHSSR